MDSDEISLEDSKETFMRLLDEFKNGDPCPKKLLREEIGKTLKSQGKKEKRKVEFKNASNLIFKGFHKRIHERQLASRALPLTLKTPSIPRIPILRLPIFKKRNERRQQCYDIWSFKEHLKRNIVSAERFDELYSLSRERSVPRSIVKSAKSLKANSEKPSAKITRLERKVKPKVISNQLVEDISKTNILLMRIRENQYENEINNNENVSKPRYSKSNSNNSVSEKSSVDKFTVLGTETSLKTQQFRPSTNSTLILSNQVDRSEAEDMNLETSENTQKDNESVGNISFVTLRRKRGPLKSSSPFLSKEDEGIEISNSEHDYELNGTSYSNLKIDDNDASKLLSEETEVKVVKSSLRMESLDSSSEKTQRESEFEKYSPILSRGQAKMSSRKRKMPLEEKAALSEQEISESEKTTETLDVWNLRQKYGKACTENIVKKAKRDPTEPVSDSEKTTELLEVYLNKFRPSKNSTLSLSSEIDRKIFGDTNLETDNAKKNVLRISSENTQKENEVVDNISFITIRKKLKNFLFKK